MPSTEQDQTLPPVEPTQDGSTAGAASAAAAVPGYEIVRELGRGGMGVVYEAKQTNLNRVVALKMILSGPHAGATEMARFVMEAEAIAAVQHPNIVPIFETGQHDGFPYLTLEYVGGGSLADLVREHPLPAEEAARLTEQIARGMDCAHSQGIIHRDLKPENVLLTLARVPKITDFGLAKRLDSVQPSGKEGSNLTRTGAIMGTPSYMAPEQAEGKSSNVGPSADIYALGAILYRLVAGRPPFQAASPLDTILQVVSDEPIAPSRLQPKLPRDLETIILKCLQKSPGKRYASAGALADDLQRYLDGRPIQARPVSALERVWKAARRRPAWTALIAATLLGIMVITGVVLTANRRLQKERDHARAAEAEADRQRVRAQQRLESAATMVERMMVRSSTERWARKPELREERRRVLEDAVAFFQGLTEEDSREPRIRREAARTWLRVASAQLALSDYQKSDAASSTAIRLIDGLIAELPTEAEFLEDRAEATSLRGHILILNARLDSGLAAYNEALEYAEKARALRPDRVKSRLTVAECLTHLGMAHSQDASGRTYFLKALAEAEQVAMQANPPYAARLFIAICQTNLALTESPSAMRFIIAEQQFEAIRDQPAPNAHAADLNDLSRAMLDIHYGDYLARTGQAKIGHDRMRRGIAFYDELLTLNPKSFPIRIRMVQAQILLIRSLDRDHQWDEAIKTADDVVRQQEMLIRGNPQMKFLHEMMQRSATTALLLRGKAGYRNGFDDLADQILSHRTADGLKYNVACAYAALSVSGSVKEREADAAKAVKLLTDLLPGSFFKSKVNVEHLSKDTDLAPLRSRSDFKEFLKRASTLPPN